MKKVLCAVLLFLPFTMFGQSPFDGTWKTDMAASKLSHKPYVFAIKDGIYDCESCAPKISVKADGQDQPVTGQPYDMLAVKLTDPNTLQATGKKAGKPTFEQTRSLSQDGKTLTVATTSYPADGSQSFKTESKLTRVSKGPAGSDAISGSWRVESVNEDTAGLTSTWKVSGNTVSMSTPTGESWEAQFDGKESPVKGVYASETVTLKKLGDRAMEVTEKRDGKVYVVNKITVSPDGKKMTTVSDNKWTGRVSTYIDEKQ